MKLWNTVARRNPDIVFIGDSITEWWRRYRPGDFGVRQPNRGIGGENSGDMLARFEQDVAVARPRCVHILGGTNDLWHTLSPDAPGRVVANVGAMIEMAQSPGIRCFIGSVPPIEPRLASDGPLWAPMIAPLNVELRALAERRGAVFVDYAAALADGMNLHPDYSDDGVHPNKAGYEVMSAVLRVTVRACPNQAVDCDRLRSICQIGE